MAAAMKDLGAIEAAPPPQEPMPVQLAVTVRRIWAIDSTEQTFCVMLTCFTYHEADIEDAIQTPRRKEKGLQLVNGEHDWRSEYFNPVLCVSNATRQARGAP